MQRVYQRPVQKARRTLRLSTKKEPNSPLIGPRTTSLLLNDLPIGKFDTEYEAQTAGDNVAMVLMVTVQSRYPRNVEITRDWHYAEKG